MPTQNIFDLVDTWNDGATTFTAVKMNVTDTASNAASLLMDLQIGGASKFKVAKDGSVVLPASASGYALWGGLPTSTGYYAASLGEQSIYSAGSKMIGIHSGSSFVVFNSRIGFSTTANYNSQDLVLTRRAAANLQLGDANAAAPVAQTLSVQSVVAGTSNTAGTNLTITGSQGTGTGAGGSIIFQVAPAGSTGTAQNALATALTINSARTATFDGTVVIPGGSSGTEYLIVGNAGGGYISSTGYRVTNNSKIEFSNGADYARAITINSGAGLAITNGSTGGQSLEFREMTAPAAPAANGVRIYAVDNGSGKTQLMALFATGAAQQIAIEP